MKAILLESKAEPLHLKEVARPVIGDDGVLIKLKASALNHRDNYIQQGTYPRTTYPIIIGSDGAGVVEDVGKNVGRNLVRSDVIINPGYNWGENPKAQQKSFTVLGFPENGTLAEYIAVPSRYVRPKPQHLTFEDAAALALVGLTAYRALFTRGNLQAGERVLVTGIGGGVAVTALQFALAAGAKVFVTSGSDEKIAKAVSLGASGGVNYTAETWADELQKRAGGFDLIVDGAAGPGFARLLDIAAPGGRIVNYGSVQGKIQNAEAARIYWKQLSILGSTMGTGEEFAAMLRFVEQHNITPVIDSVFSLADAEKAMQRLAGGKQFGKVVLRHDP
ncbi:MAG: zinc-binding dehydrogenase [Bacteroidetes bacterium]|nr:zinc-binding dehydrogenase [Bacteroidota bacterium]MCW5896475.1 zinc-binding dehydrogenase [Bacteroidota bacterium]